MSVLTLGACSAIPNGESGDNGVSQHNSVARIDQTQSGGASANSRARYSAVVAFPGVASGVAANAAATTESILSCSSKKIDYTPIPPLPAGGYTTVRLNADGKQRVVYQDWPATPKDVNKLLTNISTNITLSEENGSGGLASIFSASRAHRQYVIDFMKFRIEPLTSAEDKASGWVRVGAGLRLIVNLTKNEGSASGSLLALAASVKAGKTEGFISAELIGIDSPEASLAMPFTVDLSEGNVQKVMEALAIVKAKLYEGNTTLAPNLIARVECAPRPDGGRR